MKTVTRHDLIRYYDAREPNVSRHNIRAEWPAPIDPILAKGPEFEPTSDKWRGLRTFIVVFTVCSIFWTVVIVAGTRLWKH